jgi:hypothetical protein
VITLFGVGPKADTFPRLPANANHCPSGRMSALALAADAQRIYAGSPAGIWRSDDGGQSYRQLTRPQPAFGVVDAEIPGALFAPRVFDIAASPTDRDLVLCSATDSQFADNRDGIYRSTDGGDSWTLVLKATPNTAFNITFAPDDAQLVIAVSTGFGGGVVAISPNAGATWSLTNIGSSLWHVAIAPLEAGGVRRVYAIGDSVIWYSTDAGQAWRMDNGVAAIKAARQQLDAFQKTCDPNAGVGGFGGAIGAAVGNAAHILAVEPGNPLRVYLATTGGATGPTYYHGQVSDGTPVNTDCRRLAGEASLWVGDFQNFDAAGGAAQWSQLPGPPVYSGATTPSGNCYVETQAMADGRFLLFFSDNSHLHVAIGEANSFTAWHRLDGMDASQARRDGRNGNVLFMHVDPHAIAFTPDFAITLKPPSGVSDPYDRNSELDSVIAGRLWLANDGGVYFCDDGGKSESSWQMPSGIETVDPVNIAGLFGFGDAPALYMGCGDNNDFFTRDGGAHWGDPRSGCGDCDAWFADNANANWVLQFLPRRGPGQLGIITSEGSEYPDAGDDGRKTFVPSTRIVSFGDPTKLTPYATSGLYLLGYRPLIRTVATEAPLPDGDVVIIEQPLGGAAQVLRTTAIRSIQTDDDWHDPNKAQPIGPPLPPGAIVVQASGGHAQPVVFAGSRFGAIWKLDDAHTAWNMIVPKTVGTGTSVGSALQWFVDPFDPEVIYVLDAAGIKVSADGGDSWFFDAAMTNALTGGGKLRISASLLQDMQFSRGERQTRFAMGTVGVICTMDFGIFWFPILHSIALPGRPESGFFDPLSDPSDRAFYVECEGRSVLRIGGLPALPPFQPGSPIDLMTIAALEY